MTDETSAETETQEDGLVAIPERFGEDEDGLVRLQKLLAQSGVASRRKCEELMLDGKVEVDGEVVTRLGTKVDPRTAVVRVDGKRLPPITAKVYLVLNKPRGVVSTMSDPEGRRTIGDVVADRPERLFHVGRLDTDTSGLLLLTNDGDFAQRMAHPSYEVDKTYVAEVDGELHRGIVKQLLAGVTLDDGPVTVSAVKIISGTHKKNQPGRTIVELVIHEGRNRIVRRLLEHVGHPVLRLTRTQLGPVQLGSLPAGELRDLTQDELGELLDKAQL
jgi:23S rRNA pseudouridine2605 synthase